MIDNAIVFTEESLKKHDSELLDKVESRLTNKDNTQHYDFDDVLSENGYYDLNYHYFREYVSAIINELKAEVIK